MAVCSLTTYEVAAMLLMLPHFIERARVMHLLSIIYIVDKQKSFNKSMKQTCLNQNILYPYHMRDPLSAVHIILVLNAIIFSTLYNVYILNKARQSTCIVTYMTLYTYICHSVLTSYTGWI